MIELQLFKSGLGLGIGFGTWFRVLNGRVFSCFFPDEGRVKSATFQGVKSENYSVF